MRRKSERTIRSLLLGTTLAMLAGCASDMTGVISSDVTAFRRIEASSGAIPGHVIQGAKAVAIFSSTQAGFLIGAKGGNGLFVKRTEDGWSPPLAIDLVEGTIGLQIGAQREDIVYVFTTDESVNRFLDEGRYAVAEMSGSFGNRSGRSSGAELPTDPVTIYTRASGVYGGMIVGGMGFSIDDELNRRTYGPEVTTEQIVNGDVTPPPGSLVLWNLLDGSDTSDRHAGVDPAG